MKPFTVITAKIAPLPLSDIDTDLIIPAQYLRSISRKGYGVHLFERLRTEPEFFLNQKKYQKARILVARGNFGCGSSREHAVWALLDAGFRVIVAVSFADIFYSNSGKNGLLLIKLPKRAVETLLKKADGYFQVKVDLGHQKISLPDGTCHSFDFDPFRKECLLNGYDELSYILSNKNKIMEFKRATEETRFFSTFKMNR